jgi:DNA-directed RNA polymerase subunit M/transcription elongation factor TFIIS
MTTPAVLREYVRSKFAGLVPDRPYARNIEKSLWDWAVKETRKSGKPACWENRWFRARYKNKALHLLEELKRDPSWITCALKVGDDGRVKLALELQPQLQHRIFTKELKSTDIVNAPAEILWPGGPYSKTMFVLKQLDMRKEEARKNDEGYEGLLKCGKCKSLKTTYYQLQTRSADEPMVRFTVFSSVLDSFLTLLTDYIRHL